MRAYSFGIGNDVSWDKAMAEKYDMDIYMFDHTINRIPEDNKHFNWKKIGIAGVDQPEKSLLSMNTILKGNGDLNNKNLILKMDVEGAEWEFLESVDSDQLDNFAQMVFEFHEMYDLDQTDKIIECIRKINKTHAAVWVHGNNFSAAEYAEKYIVPWSLEILFVNRKRYCLEKKNNYFPMELDRPNNPLLEDFNLGVW